MYDSFSSLIYASTASMIVKQPQRNSIYLAICKKAITFVITMHLGQAMTVMVLFLIIWGKWVCLTFVEGLPFSDRRGQDCTAVYNDFAFSGLYKTETNHYIQCFVYVCLTSQDFCKAEVCLRIVYAETKNSGLRRSVSRCNRSVDQPGLEPGTSRLWVCCSNQLS